MSAEDAPLITGSIPAHNEASANYGTINEEPAMQGHSHSHAVASNSSLRSLLLLVALSLHSIFEGIKKIIFHHFHFCLIIICVFLFYEGLAIGLQDNAEEVLQIFAAVVLHKCVIAFGLSLNLVQSQLRTGVVIQLTLIFWYCNLFYFILFFYVLHYRFIHLTNVYFIQFGSSSWSRLGNGGHGSYG